MKPSCWVLAASIVTAFPVCASDDPSIHKVSIGGSGANPCSAWTQDRSGTTDAARQASQSRIDWISGFFSAVNLFAEQFGSLHGGIDDRDGMIAWIDTYCQEHPTDPLFVAAGDLVFDLRNHPRK
jgi:hypothetical protein